MERRLAAILAADVVGYSRMMGSDEAGTLATFRRSLDTVVLPKIDEHGGRVVKLMGDGLLAEFPSAVEAVKAALDVQFLMPTLNEEASPDEQIIYRVAINVGDIIVEGDDIFGDGVNMAARLEPLADPGGICISRSVRDQVCDRLALTIHDRGEAEVKNIARPVQIFSIALDQRASDLASGISTARRRRPLLRLWLAGAALGAVFAAVILFGSVNHVSDPTDGPLSSPVRVVQVDC